MQQRDDDNAHRNLEAVEEPLDAANQSLADALRTGFWLLKWFMAGVVVVYVFSNVLRSIGSHEQALVLRLGRLLPRVREAGRVGALPFPIDEIVRLPTKKSNELKIDSHTFRRSENEIGKKLAFITRGPNRGLHPSLEGALLTADAGLVHVRWKVTYKIEDVSGFVGEIAEIDGDQLEAARKLIQTLVETAGIQVASELTADEVIRTRVDHVQQEMKDRVNERLRALNSGVQVRRIEMYDPTPPLQVRQSFDATQRAENTKQQRIRAAQKEQTKILSEAAGAAYPRLISLLDTISRTGTRDQAPQELRDELDRMLEREVEGEAGKRIKDAGAYRAVVVSQMQSDLERYRTLLPEYQRNPMMLINRLWEQTKQQIFQSPGVVKIYFPAGLLQRRVKIPLDPEQTRIEEETRLQKKESDVSKLRKQRMVPVGPEYD